MGARRWYPGHGASLPHPDLCARSGTSPHVSTGTLTSRCMPCHRSCPPKLPHPCPQGTASPQPTQNMGALVPSGYCLASAYQKHGSTRALRGTASPQLTKSMGAPVPSGYCLASAYQKHGCTRALRVLPRLSLPKASCRWVCADGGFGSWLERKGVC